MMNNEELVNKYFQQAKDSCKDCFYAYHDKHMQNKGIVFTTNNPRGNRDKARESLREVVELGDVCAYEAQSASQALEVCTACFKSFYRKENGKPDSRSIADFLRECSV